MESNKSKQLLRNPEVEPTDSVLKESLIESYSSYGEFLNELNKYDIQLKWRYYPDGKAWLAKGIHQWVGKRGAQKEKTIFWGSIWEGYFKIVVYIPELNRDELLKLNIDEDLKKSISNIKRMGDTFKTLPIVFDVYSNILFDSFFKIINYKKGLK